MKNSISIFLFLLLFVLVVIALCFAMADISLNNLKFSIDHLYSLIGLIISVLGLLVTSYFVILAVNAYSHVKEIEKSLKKTKDIELKVLSTDKTITSTIKKIKSLTNESIMSLRYGIALQFDSTKTDVKEKYRTLKLRQARLSYQFPEYLKDNEKESAFLLLGDFGDKSDIEPLEQYIKTTKDSDELKEIAKLVISCLKKK
ncbi:MAG: hypothetical protein IKT71_04520 [Paludibacteraceae bacterium]|nr:hypothetical protein [Paludibacteraceae bacterium]